jgi:RHS repeat-associated protein
VYAGNPGDVAVQPGPHDQFLFIMKLPSRSHLRRFFRESIVATMIATMVLPNRLPAEECAPCNTDIDCEYGYLCIDGACEGENAFSVITGNARRRILDLRVLGAVSGALEWKRYHNSMPRPGLTTLGTAGCWRHNWQYELLGSASDGIGGRDLGRVFPWGNQVVFTAGANGTWTTRSPLQERLEVRANGAEVVTHEGHRLNFVRQNRAGTERFELATHTDAYGVVTTLEYDAAGNLVRVREPAGRELTLQYTTIAGHAGALISQVTGSDGRSVSYGYEKMRAPSAPQEFAALTQARYGDSTHASYSYAFVRADAQPLLVEADDPRYLGTAKRIGYTYQEPLGTIREELNPKTGAVLARLILDSAQPTKRVVSYSDLRQVSFEISADGQSVVSRTDSLGRTVRFERDEVRRITAKVEHGGRRTEFSWDAASRKLREKRPGQSERQIERNSAGRATKETDPHGRVTIFERDAAGRVTREHFHDGTTKETTYDALGFVTETRERDGAVHQYLRNAEHLVAEYLDPTGQVHRYAYDASGRKTSSTDPLGHVTRFEYNDRDDVTKTTHPGGLTSLRAYDAYGRAVTLTDAQGRATRIAYDDLGRIVRREEPAGGVTTYDYAELPKGCGSCSLSARPTRIVAPDGTVTANLYDTEGRLLSTTVAQGTAAQATTTFVYDDDNNLIARTDPLGHVTRYTYDDDHHRLTQTDALGRVTRWSYDARGNVLSQTAPDGAATQYTYDLDDLRVSTTDANGGTTKFTYDAAGRQTSLTDARGSVYRFTFDALGRKTAMIYPDDSRETWSYNAAGQLATYTTRAGQVKTASYDSAARVLAEKWSPAGAAPDVSYGYDSNSRLVSLSNGVSTLRYTYDSVGRMASETSDLSALIPGTPPRTVWYGYDIMGRRTQLVYPDGTVVKQSYDARGKLVAVATGDANPIATWSYDVTGRTAAIARANGVATAYSYDAAGQLLEVAHKKGDNVLGLARYTLDAAGRRIAQTREDGINESYNYDPTGQLTSVDYGTNPGRRETFAYDALGNRTTATDNEPGNGSGPISHAYKANNLNQYTEITTRAALSLSPTTYRLTYDANGNLNDDGKQRYSYDGQNRLVAVESRTARADLFYDANNRCVLRKFHTRALNGGWTLSTADSHALTYDTRWNLLAERTLDGRPVGEYVHGPNVDEIVRADLSAPGVPLLTSNYPLADGLGSALALADTSGRVKQRYRKSAFGRSTEMVPATSTLSSQPTAFRWIFTGRESLGVAGLQDNRHRIYSADLGRWLQTDPIHFVGGDTNLVRYVGNSPINWTDSFGLVCGGSWTDWLVPDEIGSWDFSGACATHDSCYSTLGRSKSWCDDQFYDDMVSSCGSSLSCIAVAGIYRSAVGMFGCSGYKSGQRSAGNPCPKCD